MRSRLFFPVTACSSKCHCDMKLHHESGAPELHVWPPYQLQWWLPAAELTAGLVSVRYKEW